MAKLGDLPAKNLVSKSQCFFFGGRGKKLSRTSEGEKNRGKSTFIMPAFASTSGRLHSEFVRPELLLQARRETDLFLKLQDVSLHNLPVDSSSFTRKRLVC
jgi:hypothetical protein